MLVFVTGGARSGKSRFAEAAALKLAAGRGPGCLAYLATAEAVDAEFAARIERHRAERDPAFVTVEEPLDLAAALDRARDTAAGRRPVVLLECLGTWMGNVFHHLPEAEREPFALAQADTLARAAALPDPYGIDLVVVSNEVGSGLVPPDPLTRAWCDALGRTSQRLAGAADEAWLLVAGRSLRLG